ncbi:DUF1150 family protein [Maritalea mediterranea]|uniref:DUF1150 domain-containing protein n=1 Tax=Maritalea mediterranea TaxID=2909667 RepID=A0ABS9E2Y6_9HYPH|nr:DUF1150 family protein [Maritalea mediterranea]MCF4097236.1 DUF1150 domain-containing protein [Maritalea mediterranea]
MTHFDHHKCDAPLSAEEFLALGGEEIVYRRRLTGKQLKAFLPEAKNAPEAQIFEALFSADGTPLLVTDDKRSLTDWLDEAGMDMALRH